MKTEQPTALVGNLKRLCFIRLIVLIAMLLTLSVAWQQDITLAYRPISIVLASLAALTGLSWLRIRSSWPLTDMEFFLQLLADIFGLALLLYFSGGATNPFVSYFLVPLSIAAATLPWRLTWLIALLCIITYTSLLFFHQPLNELALHHHTGTVNNLHILGMWANFALSALLITIYVVGMARALREREQTLNQLREDDLRDEQIMAVATLAAGTAHELGTPLSTMRILLDEIASTYADDPSLCKDLAIVSDQLELCRSTLQKLVATADRDRLSRPTQYAADQFFRELLDDWHIMLPAAVCETNLADDLSRFAISGDATLKQALINLLNNAREASPDGFSVSVFPEQCAIVMEILDRGPGLPDEISEQLGRPIIIGSETGLGIGLLLTHATLNRFDGEVTLYNRSSGGTRTIARLPAMRHTDE